MPTVIDSTKMIMLFLSNFNSTGNQLGLIANKVIMLGGCVKLAIAEEVPVLWLLLPETAKNDFIDYVGLDFYNSILKPIPQ